jgi:hypothetical protein
MKTLFLSLFAVVALVGASANAVETNQVPNLLPPVTNTVASDDVTKHDITISAGGLVLPSNGQSETALDFSFSFNPLASARNLWFGVAQSVAWSPQFAGSTDLDANWSVHIYKQLYLLPGWSVGTVYQANSAAVFRTSPELQAQYYLSDDVFLIGQVNYDLVSSGDNAFRWSLGLGWEF